MTNKTMPERITVHRINNGETFPDNVSVTELKPGALLPSNIDECEYIRADLVAGDANEPLEDEQLRWARYKYYSDGSERWEVVKIIIEWDDDIKFATAVDADGTEMPAKEYEMGPVIRPPEDM